MHIFGKSSVDRGMPLDKAAQVRLLDGRALVRTIDEEVKPDGLIVLSDAHMDRPIVGLVLAAAEDAEVRRGDRVIIARLSGETLVEDGVVKDSIFGRGEVLAKIEALH